MTHTTTNKFEVQTQDKWRTATVKTYMVDDLSDLPDIPAALRNRIKEAHNSHGSKITKGLVIAKATVDNVYKGSSLQVVVARIPDPIYDPFGKLSLLQGMVQEEDMVQEYVEVTYSNTAPSAEYAKPILDETIYVQRKRLALTDSQAKDRQAFIEQVSSLLKEQHDKAASFAAVSY